MNICGAYCNLYHYIIIINGCVIDIKMCIWCTFIFIVKYFTIENIEVLNWLGSGWRGISLKLFENFNVHFKWFVYHKWYICDMILFRSLTKKTYCNNQCKIKLQLTRRLRMIILRNSVWFKLKTLGSLIVSGWTRIVHLNQWWSFTFHGGLCLIWFVSHFNTKYSDMSW